MTSKRKAPEKEIAAAAAISDNNNNNNSNNCDDTANGKAARLVNPSNQNGVVTFTDISCAKFRIQNGISKTLMQYSSPLSELLGLDLHLKFELHQRTGSFKERGARNRLMLLTPEEKKKGVVAASAGNHALAMAYHGKDLGVPVTVCMPKNAPITKISNCQKLGARVLLQGDHLEEARGRAREVVEKEGLVYVNGFDDPYIIAGAGTLGLEILEQLPDVQAIVLPIGGGGLIAGVALAVKSIRPEVLIYGVEAANCPSFTAALERGQPVDVPVEVSLADGLAVCKVGSNAFEIARHLVDKVVTVTEKDISLAILKLAEVEKTVTEGAGAVGIAALVAGKFPELKGMKVVCPLCGGNIDPGVLGTVIQRGMATDGRLFRFEASISDRPGGLASFTKMIADSGASVKDIAHDRTFNLEPSRVRVQVILETRDKDHTAAVQKMLLEESSIHVRFL